MEELNDEQMYVLVAPDGFPQTETLAPDFPMCIAMIKVMADAGIGQPLPVLWDQGYKILPVLVTMKQNGDEDSAFNKAKEEINNG